MKGEWFEVEMHYLIDGHRNMSSNRFRCKRHELPCKISGWIKNIKMETGYRKTVVEKIILNGSEDIAEEIMSYKFDQDDLLPF
ncbi:hypothetical protein [Rossellomorea aquimaris]|uniref:Uncharacterized protein n=1 Tax=Rossellomorea aquimaris TaxID=189382 RepID=A0A366EGV0_9BACI|nr:hypothetical protein [Rossellomorea aquimaris]RBP01226.1 hypothetical protein DET59_12027 [Rossellomorea aquimaris]